MPREKGRKGTNGGRNLETLVKLAAPAIGTAAGAFTVVGIIYLGMTLAGLLRGGGGEIRKAVAIIVAGLTCIAFVFPISRWRLRRILESSCRENFRPLLSINIADQNTSNPESKITT